MLGGCGRVVQVTENEPWPILSQTQEDFDLATAITMIEEIERPFLALNQFSTGDMVTRAQFDEINGTSPLFGGLPGIFDGMGNSLNMLYTFFDVAHIQDPSREAFEFLGNTRYPTIFDEGIEITRAYIETTVYDTGEDFPPFTQVFLRVVQQQSGETEDVHLYGFERVYVFAQFDEDGAAVYHEDGNWQLWFTEGTINFFID